MILIIGGAFQGKRQYARQLSGLSEEEFRLRMADGMACGNVSGEISRGSFAEIPEGGCKEETTPGMREGKRILVNYHGFVRQAMSRGEDVLELTRQVLASGPDIITMDEVGCGIVPMERWERDYREAVGAAGQLLAAGASEVYRVMAGIPVRIR